MVSAQSFEFTLNEVLTVGCGSANPLTDMTKKVDVVIDGNKGKLTYASLNCLNNTIQNQASRIKNHRLLSQSIVSTLSA